MDSGERPPSDEPDDAARDDDRPDGADQTAPGSTDETGAADRAPAEDSAKDEPSEGSGTSAPAEAAPAGEPPEGESSEGKSSKGESSEGEPAADSKPSEGSLADAPDDAGAGDQGTPGIHEDRGLLYRFRHDQDGPLMWLREMLSSAAIVLVIGLVIFAFSGVWPPMVAVESASMEPNMNTGDLVFVTEPGRFAPDAADNDIGVVTHERGAETDYRSFSSYGSVIIFQPPDRRGSPIIHRAMFHVEEGEDWYERADERYHNADDCENLRNCPAPHDGFITLGDNNGQYDQVNGLAEPVQEEWVTGVARLRVPYLGYIRLLVTGQASVGDILPTVLPIDTGLVDVGAEVGDPGLVDVGLLDPRISTGTTGVVAG
ncbi:hypothetical protein JCM17823_17840 [Halorubrum gandharaense]